MDAWGACGWRGELGIGCLGGGGRVRTTEQAWGLGGCSMPCSIIPLLTDQIHPPPSPCSHHHKYPMDIERLVFPPVPAALIATPFYLFFNAILPKVRALHAGVAPLRLLVSV
jgi:hypothetical protein